MISAYKKECYGVVIWFVIMMALTHVFPLYFLFPGLTQSTLFGYPTHFMLTLVLGWPVLAVVYWVYIRVSDSIEREIEFGSVDAPVRDEDQVSGAAAPIASKDGVR